MESGPYKPEIAPREENDKAERRSVAIPSLLSTALLGELSSHKSSVTTASHLLELVPVGSRRCASYRPWNKVQDYPQAGDAPLPKLVGPGNRFSRFEQADRAEC